VIDQLYGLARPLVMALDPERAHELALRSLELGLTRRPGPPSLASLRVTAFGLSFPNPIGLAAGFDKDARVPDAVLGLGFGHVEIGSVTPLPQAGNPQPRLFRLPEDEAIINRMGFNSAGHAAVAARLKRRRPNGILAVNLGANKASPDKTRDFVAGVERLGPYASFLTINVSSPNTPGLRDLQLPEALSDLARQVVAARDRLTKTIGRRVPLVVKLSPDIADTDLPEIVARLVAAPVDGIAVSNTTLARAGLNNTRHAAETGGLSGRPLFDRSTQVLAQVSLLTKGTLPLIGVGGVDSGAAALAKIEAGATLVQLYSAMIFQGPGLAKRINQFLADQLTLRGLTSVGQLRGTQSERWAANR
jgi:dihydroorotate dehydrogenase